MNFRKSLSSEMSIQMAQIIKVAKPIRTIFERVERSRVNPAIVKPNRFRIKSIATATLFICSDLKFASS